MILILDCEEIEELVLDCEETEELILACETPPSQVSGSVAAFRLVTKIPQI